MNTKIIDCKLLIKNARALGVRTTEDAKRKAFEIRLAFVVITSAIILIGAVSLAFVIDFIKALLRND